MSKKKNNNLTQLAVCAMLIALATVLGMIKIFNLPAGGSITLFRLHTGFRLDGTVRSYGQ